MGALPRAFGFGRLGSEAVNTALLAAQAATRAAATTTTVTKAPNASPVTVVSIAAPAIPAPNLRSAVPVATAIVVTQAVATNVVAAATAVQAGQSPSPAQAVNIIKTLIPPAAGFKTNVPAPVLKGAAATSNLSGLTFRVRRSPQLGSLGATGVATAQVTLTDASAGASIGTAIVPGVGTAIGAAVGAIIGLVSGLFGAKTVIPKVTPADVAQAQGWINSYTQVAGSVIGRNFTQSAIQDMLTGMAILDPGFWGAGSSTNISIPAVNNFYGEEMTRINDFFTAMAANPVGATITMHDDPSILGHGNTNLGVTYSFINPGVNAPSYILGPIFAQYFYTMCTIFQSGLNCSGHLTAPYPQMHTDVIDWFRSQRPAWDTPQPNVVTGTDVSIAAPSPISSVNTSQPSAVETVPTSVTTAQGTAIVPVAVTSGRSQATSTQVIAGRVFRPTTTSLPVTLSPVVASAVVIPATPTATNPTAAPVNINNAVNQALQTAGTPVEAANNALATLEASGVDTTDPSVQNAVSSGINTAVGSNVVPVYATSGAAGFSISPVMIALLVGLGIFALAD